MNPRTHRRHRERARNGLPPHGFRWAKEGEKGISPNKDTREMVRVSQNLGRPARETTDNKDARALEFCEAVLACLEKGESPTLNALRQYPRAVWIDKPDGGENPESEVAAGPPTWIKCSVQAKNLISQAKIPPLVLLIAVWDALQSLGVMRARGLKTAKGKAELSKFVKTKSDRGAARSEVEKRATDWDGDFRGEEARKELEKIATEILQIYKPHAPSVLAQKITEEAAEPRKHRSMEQTLGLSRRMICYYRRKPEYNRALALITKIKTAALPTEQTATQGAAGSPSAELDEIDFENMDARLGWEEISLPSE